MARNKEKQFGKLNRLILQAQKDEHDRLHPKRPHLATLNSVNDIKEWLPSIKSEIDFNLKQSQVVCYSDDKVSDYRSNVVRLEREYKSFVRKLMQLDCGLTSVPWTDRPYESKRQRLLHEEEEKKDESDNFRSARIATPLLDGEVKRRDSVVTEQQPVEMKCELEDAPLQFDVAKLKKSRTKNESCASTVTSDVKVKSGNILYLDYSTSSSDTDD